MNEKMRLWSSISAVLVWLLLLAACSPQPKAAGTAGETSATPTMQAPTLAATDTPTYAPTLIPTASPTHTPTATSTAAPTLIPTATSLPTPTPDYSSPGNPVQPIPHPTEWIPPGFLEYNETDFQVFSRSMHNRPVTVAFANDVPLSDMQRLTVAQFALDTWAKWWDIFGGFPWPSYTIVIRNQPRRSPSGEIGIGWEDDAAHLSRSGDYEEYIGHGIFHAWWGNAVEHASNHADPATPEGWSAEGFTQYYGDRAGGPQIYRQWMAGHWSDYRAIIGTKYDVPLIEMGAYAQRTADNQYSLNVYWKGALVAYMIDERLAEQNLNLDHLMRHMYENFGLTRQRYQTEDVRASLEALTGQDWADFFRMYIYGTEPLPLGGAFDYLDH